MDRAEHLAWAKERALEYADQGKYYEAFSSLTSDLRKHPELAQHPGLEIGTMLFLTDNLNTRQAMREHIEGYA